MAVVAVLDQISWIVVGYAVLVALVAGYAAYRWRERPPWLDSMAWMLEVARSCSGPWPVSACWLSGRKPDEVSTHVGYLIASVCICRWRCDRCRTTEGAWSLGVDRVSPRSRSRRSSVRIVMTL